MNSNLTELAITGFEQVDKHKRIVVVMHQYKNTYTVSKHDVHIIINPFCSVYIYMQYIYKLVKYFPNYQILLITRKNFATPNIQ